jgi:hypothetical protein
MASAPLVQMNNNAPITKIHTATGELKASSASALLAIRGLPTQQARTVHIIPGFTNNLLSLGKLCDADCTAYIDKNKLEVHNSHGQKILHGDREQTGARLWRVNIAPSPTNAPAIIEPDDAPAVIESASNSSMNGNTPSTSLFRNTHSLQRRPAQTTSERTTSPAHQRSLHISMLWPDFRQNQHG